jgi:HEAT repeat protein
MKNYLKPIRFATFSLVKKNGSRTLQVRLVAALTLGFATFAFCQLVSQAQTYLPNKLSNISTQPSANGTVVSIATDNPVIRAQNWQDSEGYHLVLPNTLAADSLKSMRGIRLRRVGTSLEVLLQTKSGARVSVQPDGTHINLIVDSKLDTRPLEVDSRYEPNSADERQLFQDSQVGQGRPDSAPLNFSTSVEDLSSSSRTPATETSQTSGNSSLPIVPMSNLSPEPSPQQEASQSGPSRIDVQVGDEGLVASIFSGTGVFVVMALGLIGLLVSRKLGSRRRAEETHQSEEAEWVEDQVNGGAIPPMSNAQNGEVSTSLVRSGRSAATNTSLRQSAVRLPVAGPTSLYGAYRIDQEVGKLILGQPHRMDVLASRASDDRRAIETSLIKSVNAADLDESSRRRAREALEEYGFVARQCAALLLAPDAFERTSAARSLGEIKSEAALPFLLESLYDSESIVRNQAVVSIGELKLPAAIGALLDIARTHPDVPSALLSRTLSACSVEGLDFFDAVIPEPGQLRIGHDTNIIEQITHLEPSSTVEELPEDCDDEQLAKGLSLLESSDVPERSEALKKLAQFRVRSSIRALAFVARNDSEPNNRSIAISSLGSIDHESVFPAILIGMADDTREVRAAAARALNRLSFDRADAYVRVIETSDQQTIHDVASACVQAGIVSQNLDRLASSDHRQAYETFSLICLLAKAAMNDPILDAITSHPNMAVRLNAVHLLASTDQPGIFEQLRELAVRDEVCEEVKTALLEAMYKLDQNKPRQEENLEAFQLNEPPFELPETETVESHNGSDFEFDFIPAPQPEVQSPFEREVEANLDELEM